VKAIVRDGDPARSWKMITPAGQVELKIQPVLQLSSMIMIRDAVRAGAGAARLPMSLVAHDIASGRLAHWGDVPESEISLWALYPSRRLLNPRVSAFLAFLRESFPLAAPEDLAAYLEQ
jgi:DNA-binding transcriptional LysR family regulator